METIRRKGVLKDEEEAMKIIETMESSEDIDKINKINELISSLKDNKRKGYLHSVYRVEKELQNKINSFDVKPKPPPIPTPRSKYIDFKTFRRAPKLPTIKPKYIDFTTFRKAPKMPTHKPKYIDFTTFRRAPKMPTPKIKTLSLSEKLNKCIEDGYATKTIHESRHETRLLTIEYRDNDDDDESFINLINDNQDFNYNGEFKNLHEIIMMLIGNNIKEDIKMQVLICYHYIEKDEKGVERTLRGYKWSELEIIRENHDLEWFEILVNTLIGQAMQPYGDIFARLEGFKLFTIKKNYNEDDNTNRKEEIIKRLKVFAPAYDYTYHKKSLYSTNPNDKKCLIESFLYITCKDQNFRNEFFGSTTIKDDNSIEFVTRTKEVNGKEVNYVNSNAPYTKKGEIIKYFNENYKKLLKIENGDLYSMLQKGSKYYAKDRKLYVCFYKDSSLPNFYFLNGKYNECKSSEMEGKLCFCIINRSHVAPFIYKHKNITINKDEKSYADYKFKMENLKKLVNDHKIIYSFDFETYTTDATGTQEIYCAVAKHINKGDHNVFYGNNTAQEFCDWIDSISTKPNKTKTNKHEYVDEIEFYGHNSSKFDNQLIFNILRKKNPNMRYIIKGNQIIQINYHNITFRDFNLIFTNSLANLSKSFGLEENKLTFPHRGFIHKNTFDYKGKVPDLKHWNSKEDMERYVSKYGETFNSKEYCIEYCKRDVDLLASMLVEWNKMNKGYIGNKFYNTSSCATAASVSVKTMKQVFLKFDLYGSAYAECERMAYNGGRTELFKTSYVGKDGLFYIDFNSSYPAAMTRLMPYKPIKHHKNSKESPLIIDEISDINLYKCRGRLSHKNPSYIPNIMQTDSKGNIFCSQNFDLSWKWGEELKEYIIDGGKVYYKEMLEYEGKVIFAEYVKYFYNEKCKSKGSMKEFYKLMLNSLYGKFAQNIDEEIYVCSFNDGTIESLYKSGAIIKNINYISEDTVIITTLVKDSKCSIGSLVRFSSYICAVARSNLHRAIRSCGFKNVYYIDTDSIITSKMPAKEFLDNADLGKLKSELVDKDGKDHVIVEFYALAPKCYAFRVDDGRIVVKCKGFRSNTFTIDDFKSLYLGNNISMIKDVPSMFKRSITEGIKINDGKRTLSKVLTKRKWIDGESLPFKDREEYDSYN